MPREVAGRPKGEGIHRQARVLPFLAQCTSVRASQRLPLLNRPPFALLPSLLLSFPSPLSPRPVALSGAIGGVLGNLVDTFC